LFNSQWKSLCYMIISTAFFRMDDYPMGNKVILHVSRVAHFARMQSLPIGHFSPPPPARELDERQGGGRELVGRQYEQALVRHVDGKVVPVVLALGGEGDIEEEVQGGDVFFLPAGRVHTIGKGLLIAEIQQTSDITYRIYDFDRVDAQGNKRELHVEEALDAIDFKPYDHYKSQYVDRKNNRVTLEDNQYFTTNKLDIDAPTQVSLPNLDCFKIYICLQGQCTITNGKTTESLSLGEVMLVPATWKNYDIEPAGSVTLLESYIDG